MKKCLPAPPPIWFSVPRYTSSCRPPTAYVLATADTIEIFFFNHKEFDTVHSWGAGQQVSKCIGKGTEMLSWLSLFVWKEGSKKMLKNKDIPFQVTDWSKVPATTHPGETGTAIWRTLHLGDVRVRMIEYSPGYLADHWCEKGHILFVLKGELVSELKDGRKFHMTAGMSYEVSDNMSSHRSYTEKGATLFVVDGTFLAPQATK